MVFVRSIGNNFSEIKKYHSFAAFWSILTSEQVHSTGLLVKIHNTCGMDKFSTGLYSLLRASSSKGLAVSLAELEHQNLLVDAKVWDKRVCALKLQVKSFVHKIYIKCSGDLNTGCVNTESQTISISVCLCVCVCVHVWVKFWVWA